MEMNIAVVSPSLFYFHPEHTFVYSRYIISFLSQNFAPLLIEKKKEVWGFFFLNEME